jgi:hypothetical protein
MAAITNIVAAVTRKLSGKNRNTGGTGRTTGWQILAMDLAEEVPEVGAYADWVSNSSAGATLFAGRRLPDGSIQRAPAGTRAADLVASMAGGPDGQSQLLSDFAWNLAVTGEAFLVIQPDTQSDSFVDDQWHVLSIEEVSVKRGGAEATIDGGKIEIPEYDADNPPEDDEPILIRVWRPSKRRRQDAISPVRSSITVLEELRLLNAAVAAITRSRITGRGVLLVPAGASFPGTPGQAGADETLLDTFIEVASTAIREPDSAAATVPVVIEVPGDLIGGVKWLSFESGYDDMLMRLRDEAIRRFAAGVDIPAEVLLGLGDSNHWNAWQIQAEAIKQGIEPALKIVANALTVGWLQPLLSSEGYDDASQWLVWYDTSSLRSSSNKAASAIDAFDKGIIGAPAARRELGFEEADAPAPTSAPSATSSEERTTDVPVSESQTPPLQPSISMAASGNPALYEALDGLVWTALTTAGHRLRLTPAVPRPERGSARMLPMARTHESFPVPDAGKIDGWKLLDGAWDRVGEIAQRTGADAETITAALDTYVRGLLLTGGTYSYERLGDALFTMDGVAA